MALKAAFSLAYQLQLREYIAAAIRCDMPPSGPPSREKPSEVTKKSKGAHEEAQEWTPDYWVAVPGLMPRWGQFHSSGGPKGPSGTPEGFFTHPVYVSPEEKGLGKCCSLLLLVIFLVPWLYEYVFDVDLSKGGDSPYKIIGISNFEWAETLDKKWGTLINEGVPTPDFERWKEVVKSYASSAAGDDSKKSSARAASAEPRKPKGRRKEKTKADSRQSSNKNDKKTNSGSQKKKKDSDQKDFFQGESDKHVTIEDFGKKFKQLNRKDGQKLIDASLASLMREFDADEDGKVTLKEILPGDGVEGHLCEMFPYWKDSFVRADAGKDGYLTDSEFAYLLKDLSKKRVEELLDPVESILTAVDTDKNRKISMQELLYYARDDADARRLQDWMDELKTADTNKDDQLNAEELIYLLNHVGKKAIANNIKQLTIESLASNLKQLPKKSADKLIEDSIGVFIKEFDADKDGKVSLKEILPGDGSEAHLSAIFPYWKDGFNDADGDKDGYLTPKEFTSLLTRLSKARLEEFFDPVESIMSGFDTDKNGKISLEELLQHTGGLTEDSPSKMVHGWKEGFKEADADGDAYFIADELVYFLNEVGAHEKGKHEEL